MSTQALPTRDKARKSPVRSQYLFPAYGFSDGLELARYVERDGGGTLTEATLAVNMSMSAKSSAFRLRGLTARQFGLLLKTGEQLTSTPLLKAILKPTSEAERVNGLREAYLRIPLFKAVADRFKGQPLPQSDAFRNVLEREFGIEEARVQAAERVLMDSARDAGVLVNSGGNTYLATEGMSQPPAVSSPLSQQVQAHADASSQAPAVTVTTSRPNAVADGGVLLISERDLGELADKEFQEVWSALGKVFRARGKRQLVRDEMRGNRFQETDVDSPA